MGEALSLTRVNVERQRAVVAALRGFLPQQSVLWREEEPRPYECDGLTAYRHVPMVVALPDTEEQVLACRFQGTRYDCGTKLGYLQAMVAFGRKHPEVGAAFDAYLKELGGTGQSIRR